MAVHPFRLTLAFLAMCFVATLTAADLKPTAEGMAIEAGSLGSFTLTYPEFIDGAQAAVHKKIETKLDGGVASVRYEGGAIVEASAKGGQITLNFKVVPADVKSWKMTMLIDIGFAKGGSWKAGKTEGVFPMEKGKVPQFHSTNGSLLQIKSAQGQSLSFTVPDYAFQQLTDNREWNWAVYQWQFIVPYNADQPTATV
ncbi:MAG: hypothetical protein U0984_18310, partial [Prosthecobacter sp.]|nr:hypothetical protein [Prosthecobacter sp.]